MKKLFIVAVILCLAVPSLVFGQEAEKKPSPLQVYLSEKTPENFVEAYNTYNAQIADSMDYSSVMSIAWLNLFELDRNEEAIAVYEKLNEATPKWSCPWRHKGQAYYQMKNYPEAEKALLKAIETRKEHYDAYIWLAEVYRDWGQYDKGIATLAEGLSYYGKDIEDPEKEYSSVDVAFLHLDLLKKAGKSGTEAYQHVLEHAKILAPEDERLKQY